MANASELSRLRNSLVAARERVRIIEEQIARLEGEGQAELPLKSVLTVTEILADDEVGDPE